MQLNIIFGQKHKHSEIRSIVSLFFICSPDQYYTFELAFSNYIEYIAIYTANHHIPYTCMLEIIPQHEFWALSPTPCWQLQYCPTKGARIEGSLKAFLRGHFTPHTTFLFLPLMLSVITSHSTVLARQARTRRDKSPWKWTDIWPIDRWRSQLSTAPNIICSAPQKLP